MVFGAATVAFGVVAVCAGSSIAPTAARAVSAADDNTTLLQFDFNGENVWPEMATDLGPKSEGFHVRAERKLVGTIDAAGSGEASGGVALTIADLDAKAKGSAFLNSGLLALNNQETNLGKLTLSFSLSVSAVRPVTVRIESFDAKKKRTGGRETLVYPAAPNFYQRFAIDLSTMKSAGGAFQPTAPFVRLSLGMEAGTSGAELRLDNVHFARPAYYVSPSGDDKNDGRTEKTAFADPQKAAKLAQPGDIILLMEGTYHRAPTSSIHEGVFAFRRAGTPAAWISLKNYPGQHPVLTSDAWNTIKVGRGSAAEPSKESALAYLEVRGLHIRGNADIVKEKYADLIEKVNPLTNSNGIGGFGNHETYTPHHLRFADNVVEFCSGAGIGMGDCDWVTVENNVIRNNCWWMIYAGSGISLLGTANFDSADNVYKSLIRNNQVSGNRCFVKWKQIGKFSDGNGIIIDTNYVPAKNKLYLGRTLVQNNLSFNNGGSGIHAFRSHQVDIINNTAYYNGATPELNWGQIFVQICDDVRITNNILVSRPGQPINSVGPDGGDQKSTKVAREYNLYFGGLPPKLTGENDVIADPLFVHASTDAAVADFRVCSDSPARKSGWQGALVPLRDLNNKPRPTTAAPDRGAYQQ